jgi:hypothetical protein
VATTVAATKIAGENRFVAKKRSVWVVRAPSSQSISIDPWLVHFEKPKGA